MKTRIRALLPGLLVLAVLLALIPALTQTAQAADSTTPLAQSYGNVWYTAANGSRVYGNKPYYTMDEAWEAACEGTAIQLTADWNFRESGRSEGFKVSDGKSATIYLDGHTIDCAFDKPNSSSNYTGAFWVGADSTLRVFGAGTDSNGSKVKGTIKNAFANYGSYEDGGLVRAYARANVQIEDVLLFHCTSWTRGGVIFSEASDTSVTLKNVDFEDCSAKEGAGGLIYMKNGKLLRMEDCSSKFCEMQLDDARIYVCGVDDVELTRVSIDGTKYYDYESGMFDCIALYAIDCDLRMTDCLITNCRPNASGNDRGGGVYAKECRSVTLDGVRFEKCYAHDAGGALCITDTKGATTLKDVTITDCNTRDAGGGIYMENNGAATLTNVTVTNCAAQDDFGYAGGICIVDNSPVTMTNVNVSGCTSYRGGGGIYVDDTSVEMTDCKIENCQTYGSNESNGSGGGISLNGSVTSGIKTATLTRVKVYSCQAARYGGGIYSDCYRTTLTDCDVAYCQSKEGGGVAGNGAVGLSGKTYSLSMSGTQIHSCQATTNGGGLDLSGCEYTLSDSELRANSAAKGGGIYFSASGKGACQTENIKLLYNYASENGGGAYVVGSADLSNMVIEDNVAANYGGGVYGFSNSKITVSGSTRIRDNSAKRGGGIYSADARYSKGSLVMKDSVVISGNRATEEYGGGVYAEGNIDVTVGGTLHLTENKAAGKADDLCMNGSLTTDGLVTSYTGMDLMKNARIGISSANNTTIELGRLPNRNSVSTGEATPVSPTAFYCTDPDMDFTWEPDGSTASARVSTNWRKFPMWNANEFSIDGQLYCEVDEKAATIHVTMPKGTDLTRLTARFDGRRVSSFGSQYTADYNTYYNIDTAMLQKGDFSKTVAYSFQSRCVYGSDYYVSPLRIWYVTVDCNEKDYAAYTVDGGSRKYYASFAEAWAYANAHDCTVGLLRDLTLNEPLTVSGSDLQFVTLDLNGYTLSRGLTMDTARDDGYAFFVGTRKRFTIQDSSQNKTGKVTGCHTTGNGGVFRQVSNSKVQISSGTFTGNSAQNGAIAYLGEPDTAVYILDGTFTDNVAQENGGVVCMKDGGGYISGGMFRNNHANQNGGVFASLPSSYTRDPRVRYCTMTGNTAGKDGGAIYYEASVGNEFTLEGISVTGNQAEGEGGGVYIKDTVNGLIVGYGTTIKNNTCGRDYDRQSNASNLYLDNSLISRLFLKQNPTSGSSALTGCEVYVGSNNETSAGVLLVAGLSREPDGTDQTYRGLYASEPGYINAATGGTPDTPYYVYLIRAVTYHTVTVTNGYVGSDGNKRYAQGDTVTVMAGPAPDGTIFDKWVCDLGGVTFANEAEENTTFTMPDKDVVVRATYKAGRTYTLSVVGGTGGGEYAPGKTVTITANAPAWGKEFASWMVDGAAVTLADATAATTTLVMPEQDVTVRAGYRTPLQTITQISIKNLKQPVAGEELSNFMPGTQHVEYSNYKWQGPEGVMRIGQKAGSNSQYLFMITLSPTYGYQIPADVAVTFGDRPATRVYPNADGSVTAYCVFEKTGPDTLLEVEWPVGVTIRQGETPSLPDRVTIRTKCATADAAKVTWSPKPVAAAAAGKVTYTGTLTLPEGVADPDGKGTGSITVTVKAPDKVGAITIETAENADHTVSVTLSCATEGATLLYTVDDGARQAYRKGEPFRLGDALLENGGSAVYVLRVTASKTGMTDNTAFATIAVDVPERVYTVTVNGGVVANGGASAEFAKSSIVAIKAAPEADQVFRSWSGSYVGAATGVTIPLRFTDANASTTTFTMPNGPVSVTADFVDMLDEAALTMDEPESGENLTLPETASYEGTDYPVSWATDENGDEISCTATITIPADLADARYFAAGTAVTINDEEVDAADVRVSGGSLTITKTYTLPAPTGPLYTVTLCATVGDAGKTTVLGSYPAGKTVTITAPHEENYSFVMWAAVVDDADDSEVDIDGLSATFSTSATFTMPEKNISVIGVYTALISEIDLTIPAPEAGKDLAQYPTAIRLKLVDGSTLSETDAATLQQFPIAWDTTADTAVFGTPYIANVFAVEGDNLPALADDLTIRVNGEPASASYTGGEGAYYVRVNDTVQIFTVFPPAPATMTGLQTPADIHDIEPGTTYGNVGLPDYVEAQTSCGAMAIPVTWMVDEADTTPNDGTEFVELTGALTYPDALERSGYPDTVTLRVYLDAQVIVPETVATPTAVPSGSGAGEYKDSVEVSLFCATPDATIYYTLDGSAPTPESLCYDGTPIVLTDTTTICAYAVRDGMTPSTVATFTYTVYKTYPVYYSYEQTSYTHGRFKAGETVTVEASDLPAKTFTGWTAEGITLTAAQAAAKEVTFTMPAHQVTFTPVYAANASIITELTFTIPRLIAGQALPGQAAYTAVTPAGSHTGSIAVTWNSSDAVVAYGTTYTATVEFAGTVMEGFQFTGVPSVRALSRAADGSTTRLSASCTRCDAQSATITFSCAAEKPKLLRVEKPADRTGLPNGILLSTIKEQLGDTLRLITDEGSANAAVEWTVSAGSYDPASSAEQSFTLTGSFTIPADIDPNGVANTVTVAVTVSAKGYTGAPTASVAEGSYDAPQTVELSSLTDGAVIYYTLDGTAPTTSSAVYTAPIPLRTTTTIRAFAVKDGMLPSIVSTYVYTIRTASGSSGHNAARTDTGDCTGGPECPSRAFDDLRTSAWYHLAVDYVLNNQLMRGVGNGQFRPNEALSRAMLAQILYNAAGCPAVTGGSGFVDVADGAWYADAVAWASANGIVTGYGGGVFGANNAITREQLALMLWRYAGCPAASGKTLVFTDADQISSWALEAVRWAAEKGILSGYADGSLAPRDNATRAQVAQMLKRFLELA